MNIILKAAAALLAVTLAASCVFEKEEPSQTQQKYKYVLVQLGVNTDKMTATKADGDVTESDPETVIKDLRVYAYTNEKKDGVTTKRLCGYLYAEDVDAAETSGSPLLMDIKVPFNEYEKEQTVYFAAVANTGAMDATEGIIINELGRNPDGSLDLPSNFSWDGFSDIIYKINQAKFATTGMPMYFQTDVTKDPVDQSADDYDPENKEDDDAPVLINLKAAGQEVNVSGHNGHTKLPIKVTLGMTRSLAKIEVYAAEDAGQGTSGTSTAGIQITEVELMNVIANGPLFPAEASTDTLTTNPKLDGKAVALSASATDKADTTKYTKITNAYYLAENDYGVDGEFYYGDDLDKIAKTHELTADDLKATTLKIGYKVGINGDQKYGYVIMPPIERNTWYKVLARITAGGQMNLTFVAQPWNLYTESISYSDQITVSEGGRIRWINHQPDLNAEIVTYGEDIKCEFKIDTPSGAMWHASFIPVSGDANAFGFEKNGVISSVAEGKVGENANLTIRPLGKDLTQNNVAILRIVVKTTDGRTIAVVKNDVLSGNSSYNNKEYTITHSK